MDEMYLHPCCPQLLTWTLISFITCFFVWGSENSWQYIKGGGGLWAALSSPVPDQAQRSALLQQGCCLTRLQAMHWDYQLLLGVTWVHESRSRWTEALMAVKFFFTLRLFPYRKIICLKKPFQWMIKEKRRNKSAHTLPFVSVTLGVFLHLYSANNCFDSFKERLTFFMHEIQHFSGALMETSRATRSRKQQQWNSQ